MNIIKTQYLRFFVTGSAVVALVLAVTTIWAAGIRLIPNWSSVIGAEDVWLQSNDSWYHLRLIRYLFEHFPVPLLYDHAAVVRGMPVPVGPALDWLGVGLAHLSGCQAQQIDCIDRSAALLPVVIAAFIPVSTYVILRQILSRWAAVAGVTIAALVPGPLLTTSLLGLVDHHILEALLTLLMLGAAVAACRNRSRLVFLPLLLTAYHLSWSGASLFVFALGLWWLMVHLVATSDRERVDRVLIWALTPTLLTVVLARELIPRSDIQTAALATLLTIVIVWQRFSRRLTSPRESALGVCLFTLSSAAVGYLLISALAPELLQNLWLDLQRFSPGEMAQTVHELVPLLGGGETPSLARFWIWFGPAGLLAIYGFTLLAMTAFKTKHSPLILICAWSIVCLLATMGQNRFGYYLGTLLPIWLAFILHRLSFLATAAAPVRIILLRQCVVACIAVSMIAWPFAVRQSWQSRLDRGPSAGWRETLAFLRELSPTPKPVEQSPVVLAWWDRGYLLLVKGGVVPVTNPSHINLGNVAAIYLEEDPDKALDLLEQWNVNLVVVEQAMRPTLSPAGLYGGFFASMAVWNEMRPEHYVQRGDGGGVTYTQAYYRTFFGELAESEKQPRDRLSKHNYRRVFHSTDGSVSVFEVNREAQAEQPIG